MTSRRQFLFGALALGAASTASAATFPDITINEEISSDIPPLETDDWDWTIDPNGDGIYAEQGALPGQRAPLDPKIKSEECSDPADGNMDWGTCGPNGDDYLAELGLLPR